VKSIHAARHLGGGLFYALATLGSARMSPPRDSKTGAERLSDALEAIAVAHDIAPTVYGEVPRGPVLLVANHVSYLDPIAILPIVPAVPVAKGEVAQWPIVGAIGEQLGVMFVKRCDPQGRIRTLRRMSALLANGTSVLNFPEGTTTRGDAVGPFWRGSFGVAARLGVPVVPLAVKYADPALAWYGGASFLPHYLDTVGRRRIDVELRFGSPLYGRTGEPAEVMAARARNAVARLLERSLHAGPSLRLPETRTDALLPPTTTR